MCNLPYRCCCCFLLWWLQMSRLFNSTLLLFLCICNSCGIQCGHKSHFNSTDGRNRRNQVTIEKNNIYYTRLGTAQSQVKSNMIAGYTATRTVFVWHGSWVGMTWVMDSYNIGHGFVWHWSWVLMTWVMGSYDMGHGFVWHGSWVRMTWVMGSYDMGQGLYDIGHGFIWHGLWVSMTLVMGYKNKNKIIIALLLNNYVQ